MKAEKVGRGMIFLAAVAVLLGLSWFFQEQIERQINPNAEPLSSRSDGVAEVRLLRNRYGHYVASGQLNNEDVVFLLDTGATDVAVSADLASELNLPRGPDVMVRTANGTVRGYRTRIDQVRLGNIVRENVPATIAPGMEGEDVLLGMSFLQHLELVQKGETLTLRQ